MLTPTLGGGRAVRELWGLAAWVLSPFHGCVSLDKFLTFSVPLGKVNYAHNADNDGTCFIDRFEV